MASAAARLLFDLTLDDRKNRRRSTASGVELWHQLPGTSRPPRQDPLTFPAACSDRTALTLIPRSWRGDIPGTPGQPEYADSQTVDHEPTARASTRVPARRPRPGATRRAASSAPPTATDRPAAPAHARIDPQAAKAPGEASIHARFVAPEITHSPIRECPISTCRPSH